MNELTLENLFALEHRGWDSLCDATGGDFYGDLMTAEAVMVLVNGMVLDRATISASLNDSPAWDTYALTEPRLVPVGADSVALVYRATASRLGEDEPFTALMTSTYRLVQGRPRLAMYQQTTITHQG